MLFFEFIRIALGRQDTFSHTLSGEEWHGMNLNTEHELSYNANFEPVIGFIGIDI